LQRLADQVDGMSTSSAGLVVAIVGGDPYDVDQIDSFLADSVGSMPVVGLPVDDLTAAVYAGRTGVSMRRLARLPLGRAARHLALVVDGAVQERTGSLWKAAR
jgi:hypothetical protein